LKILTFLLLLLILPLTFAQEEQTNNATVEEDKLVKVVLGTEDATSEEIRIAYKVILKRLKILGYDDVYLGKFDKENIVLYLEQSAHDSFDTLIVNFIAMGGLDFSLVKPESVYLLPEELTVLDLQEAAFNETDIERVKVVLNEYSGEPELLIEIKESSQDEFESFTQSHVEELLVISSSSEILMTPILMQPLRESALVSDGNRFNSMTGAELISLSIVSGRLPMNLEIVEMSLMARAKAKF